MTIKEKINVRELKFRVPIVIEPDGDGFYAHSPALPGLMMDGETIEEALQSAREGAIALLQSMIRDGDPIPLSIAVSNNKPSTKVNDHKRYYQEEISVTIELNRKFGTN